MTHSSLSAARTPFIRLLVPLLAGIVGQEALHLPTGLYLLPTLGGVVLWVLFAQRGNIETQYRKRPLFGWGLFLLVFSLGAFLHALGHRSQPLPQGFYPVAIAHIDQKATEKPNAYYCPATLTALADSTGHTVPYHERVALYFGKSLYARRLTYGDRVAFAFQPRAIEASSNPGDFDFATYMRHQGITRSQYLTDSQWRRLDHASRSAFWEWATSRQSQLAYTIDTCRLSPTSAALLKALLLGDRQDFPAELQQSFSAAGLSHILAVSGLHMGVMAALVYLLLFPLAWSKAGRKLRPLLTLFVLWGYGCLTGLSPSTTRACIMASFLLTADFLGRRNSSLNALFAAAFFLLLYDTDLLFDVGFQMSFAAVAAILLFYRRLHFGQNSPYRIIRWVSSCVAVSIAAQIGALPIAVYYFHTLPLLFLVGNLVVLPLLPVIFGAGVLLLLLTSLHLPYEWIAAATDLMLRFVEWLSLGIARLPGSHIEGIWLAPRYLFLYFGTAILGYIAIKNRSKKMLWLTLTFGIAFLVTDLSTYRPPRPEAVVYDDRQTTVVELSDREGCYLLLPDTLPPQQPPVGEAHRQQMGHRDYALLHPGSAPVEKGSLFIAYPFAQFYATRLLLLDGLDWQRVSTDRRLAIDHAIIDRRFTGHIADVVRLFDVHHFIIGANVHPSRARRLIKECSDLGIPCHDVRSQGAWIYSPAP